MGSKATNEELNISFDPTPDYPGIAKAAAGGNLWTGTAGNVGEVSELLPKAGLSGKNGIGAVLGVQIGGEQERGSDQEDGGGKAV